MGIIVNKSSLEDTKKYFAIKQVFKFEELTEEQKEKALSKLREINVYHDWWDFIFQDAEEIGLKITSFDLDRNRHAKGILLNSGREVAEKIIKNHGQDCETFKTATNFLAEWDELVKKYSDGVNTDIVTEENEYDFDQEADELEEDFLQAILEDYSVILQEECDYLQSDEAIIETIDSNKYFFDEEGNLI